jgi:hypothetical protein
MTITSDVTEPTGRFEHPAPLPREESAMVEEWFSDGESLEYDVWLLHKLDDEWDPSLNRL